MNRSSSHIPFVLKQDVEFFVDLFKQAGDDVYALLREAKVPNDLKLADSQYSYLPETTVKNLIALLGQQSTLDDFTVNVWLACKQTYVPRFLEQLTAPASVKQAIEQFCKILPSVSTSAEVSLEFAGGRWWFTRKKTYSDDPWFKYAEIFSVIFMNQLLLALTDQRWKADEVAIQSKDISDFAYLPELASAQFYSERPVTALSIAQEFIHLPAQGISGTSTLNIPDAPAPNRFVDAFKLVISPYLSAGKLPIKWAADILNIHTRTIQRRLEDDGVTYSKVVEQLVLEQTLDLLANSSAPVTAIASKMGYSDSAHFTRAFKRQMGMTPSQYRKQNKP